MRDASPQPRQPAAPAPEAARGPAPATPSPGGHAPPNPPPAGRQCQEAGVPSPQDCRYRPGLKTPTGALETPRPGQRPCSPSRSLSSKPLVWLREARRCWLPSCRHPRGRDLGRPSAPGSGGFLAFRPVPELSSLGTSRRRLEAASSGPLAVSSGALPPAPASPRATTRLCSSSQQRKHVTVRAKTVNVIDPWPILLGFPRPRAPWEM